MVPRPCRCPPPIPRLAFSRSERQATRLRLIRPNRIGPDAGNRLALAAIWVNQTRNPVRRDWSGDSTHGFGGRGDSELDGVVQQNLSVPCKGAKAKAIQNLASQPPIQSVGSRGGRWSILAIWLGTQALGAAVQKWLMLTFLDKQQFWLVLLPLSLP